IAHQTTCFFTRKSVWGISFAVRGVGVTEALHVKGENIGRSEYRFHFVDLLADLTQTVEVKSEFVQGFQNTRMIIVGLEAYMAVMPEEIGLFGEQVHKKASGVGGFGFVQVDQGVYTGQMSPFPQFFVYLILGQAKVMGTS